MVDTAKEPSLQPGLKHSHLYVLGSHLFIKMGVRGINGAYIRVRDWGLAAKNGAQEGGG